MLSDEQLARIFVAHGVAGNHTRELTPYQITDLAHAIEREATAEATRIMAEWHEAREAVLNWQNKNVMYRPPVSMIQRVAAAEQAIRDFVERMK